MLVHNHVYIQHHTHIYFKYLSKIEAFITGVCENFFHFTPITHRKNVSAIPTFLTKFLDLEKKGPVS